MIPDSGWSSSEAPRYYTPPEAIAQLALEAMKSRRFYALADWPVWEPVVSRRFYGILERLNPDAPTYP